MRIARVLQLIVASVLLNVTVAPATSLYITNSSFENISGTVVTPSSLGVTIKSTNTVSMNGWTVSAGSSALGLLPSSFTIGNGGLIGCPTPKDGTNAVEVSLGIGAGATIALSQTLTTAFLPNTAYKLYFDIDPGLNLSLLGTTTLGLTAGATPVATLSSVSLLGQLSAANTFQTVELDYTTGSTAPTGNIGLSFQQNSVAGLGGNIYVDNAQLVLAPVPEPNAVVILMAGLGLLCVINRTRKKLA